MVTRLPFLKCLDRSQPHTFLKPVKRINEGQDVLLFHVSEGYRDIITFLSQLNHAMFPSINHDGTVFFELGSPAVDFSPVIVQLRHLLGDLESLMDEAPPATGPRRFGNVSFRTWCGLLEDRGPELLRKYLPDTVLSFNQTGHGEPLAELEGYLNGSFGSSQRLDYGTGHELSFLAFLGCIWKLGGFPGDTAAPGDAERAIVLGVIDR